MLVLVFLALFGVMAMLASGVRGGPLDPPSVPSSTDSVRLPGTPISGPTTIATPGHYYLTRNITVAGNATAIAITAEHVSLDLGGFTLRGGGAGGTGVSVANLANFAAIRNGTIRSFQFGIAGGSSFGLRVDDVRGVENARGIEAGTAALITDCVADNNQETGIRMAGSDTRVSGCSASNNEGPGITVDGDRSVVESSSAFANNGDQFSGWTDIIVVGSASTVKDNVVGGRNFGGIRLTGTGNVIVDNVCVASASIVDTTGPVGANNTVQVTARPNAACALLSTP